MIRALFILLVGLIGGGIIHIVGVLGLARMVEPDHYARFATFGPNNAFNLLRRVDPQTQPLPLLDPSFSHALCRFSVAAEPLRIRVVLPDRFWSLALIDRHGTNVYHVNDRVGEGKPVELLVLTPRQVARLRESPPDDLDSLSVIEWPRAPEGAALIRAFTPNADQRAEFARALKDARCLPMSAS